MSIRKLDLNLLVVFDAISAEQNLTRAAERLQISQPAVSNALARLRIVLNDPLFVRAKGKMLPTPRAQQLRDRVRRAVELAEGCLEPDADFDASDSDRTFRCSMSQIGELLLLPRLIADVEFEAPMASIRSYYVKRQDTPTELASGSLDIAIDVPFAADPNLCSAHLFTVEYACAVRPKHPGIRRKPSLKQFLAQRHLHVSGRRSGGGAVDQALKKLGKRRQVAVRVRDYTVAAEVVAQSDLVCALPAALARNSGLKAYPMPFDTPPAQMNLYWHKRADGDPAIDWLRDRIQKIAEGV